MLPDVIDDTITDAARRLELDDVHQFFLLASHEHRDNDVHGTAQTAFFIWARQGYKALPDYMKEFALRVCDGEYKHNQGRSVIRNLYVAA